MEQTSIDRESELKRQFEAALSRVKYELERNLSEIDLLNTEKLENMLQVFNQRLIIFQHEFIEHITRLGNTTDSSTGEFRVEAPPWDRIPEIAAAILAGGAGGIAVALIPITTGFWLWASTVTAAAAAGAAIGVPVGVATAGVGIIVGAGVGVCTALVLKKRRRKFIKKRILIVFDKDVAPKLREWAISRIKV